MYVYGILYKYMCSDVCGYLVLFVWFISYWKIGIVLLYMLVIKMKWNKMIYFLLDMVFVLYIDNGVFGREVGD